MAGGACLTSSHSWIIRRRRPPAKESDSCSSEDAPPHARRLDLRHRAAPGARRARRRVGSPEPRPWTPSDPAGRSRPSRSASRTVSPLVRGREPRSPRAVHGSSAAAAGRGDVRALSHRRAVPGRAALVPDELRDRGVLLDGGRARFRSPAAWDRATRSSCSRWRRRSRTASSPTATRRCSAGSASASTSPCRDVPRHPSVRHVRLRRHRGPAVRVINQTQDIGNLAAEVGPLPPAGPPPAGDFTLALLDGPPPPAAFDPTVNAGVVGGFAGDGVTPPFGVGIGPFLERHDGARFVAANGAMYLSDPGTELAPRTRSRAWEARSATTSSGSSCSTPLPASTSTSLAGADHVETREFQLLGKFFDRRPNTAPVARADGAGTRKGSSVTIDVVANDEDVVGPGERPRHRSERARAALDGSRRPGRARSCSTRPLTTANGGTVRRSTYFATGKTQLVYTPPADFTGIDTFRYVVQDTGGPHLRPRDRHRPRGGGRGVRGELPRADRQVGRRGHDDRRVGEHDRDPGRPSRVARRGRALRRGGRHGAAPPARRDRVPARGGPGDLARRDGGAPAPRRARRERASRVRPLREHRRRRVPRREGGARSPRAGCCSSPGRSS